MFCITHHFLRSLVYRSSFIQITIKLLRYYDILWIFFSFLKTHPLFGKTRNSHKRHIFLNRTSFSPIPEEMLKKNAKITPSVLKTEHEASSYRLVAQSREVSSVSLYPEKQCLKMRVMRLHTLFKLYGSQRHPRLDTFQSLKEKNENT